jgi:hypothetical protein
MWDQHEVDAWIDRKLEEGKIEFAPEVEAGSS